MDAKALRAIRRPKLQKLAKANGIKGNLKTDVIVDLLLQRYPDGVPVSGISPESPTETPVPEPPAPPQQNRRIRIIGPKTPQPQISAEEQVQNETAELQSTDLAPEKHLRRAVDIMASISARDHAALATIAQMRTAAAEVRKKSEDLRKVIRAERGRRLRIESYLRYWKDIDPAWTTEELWSMDRFRYLPVGEGGRDYYELSTDESSDEEEEIDGVPTWRQGDSTPPGYRTADSAEKMSPPVNKEPRIAANTQASGVHVGEPECSAPMRAGASDVPVGPAHPITMIEEKITRAQPAIRSTGKRRREAVEGDSDDQTRYSPRTRKSVKGKGKGKMTAAEVAAMQLEKEIEASKAGYHVSEDDVDRNAVLALLAAEAEDHVDMASLQHVPVPDKLHVVNTGNAKGLRRQPSRRSSKAKGKLR